MTEQPTPSPQEEKRRFFRIEDLAHLTCTVLDDAAFAEKTALLEKGVSGEFLMLSDLAAITSDMAVTLHKIEAFNPEVADYLKSLDKKIDLIGQTLMSGEFGVDTDAATELSLSASGLAMQTRQKFTRGANLEIKMVLLPDHVGILAYGQVVNIEPGSAADTSLVRVDFTHIRDADRDVLIRHIMRNQGEMLRERRHARERGEG